MGCITCGFEDVKNDLDTVLDLQEAHQEKLGADHFVEFELTENPSVGSVSNSIGVGRSGLDMRPDPTMLSESLTDQLQAIAEHYEDNESGVITKAVEQGLDIMYRSMLIEQYESDEISGDEVVGALGQNAVYDLD